MKEKFNLYLNSTDTLKSSTFSGSITTTVLTISTGATSGYFPILGEIGGYFGIMPGTYITSYGSGDSTGVAGTYNLNFSQTVQANNTMYCVMSGQGSQVYDISKGKNYYSYYINWDAVLPRKYRKFNVSFSFNTLMSTNGPLSPASLVILSTDFGSFSGNEPNGGSNHNLGMITIGTMVGTTNYRFQALHGDNPASTINYPSNNVITIGLAEINQLNNYALSNTNSGSLQIGNYMLILSFEPIDEE
jgi:hypothetical protein